MEIIQFHEKTIVLQQLQALLPRYAQRDKTYEQLLSIYKRENAGDMGESSLTYYLRLADINDAFVIYGIRLREPNGYFQIDVLVLTPKVCFVIEVKNITGNITINESGQMIRSDKGSSDTFPHPMIQANIQARHLEFFLKQLNHRALPIHPMVVFTHPNVILDGKFTNDDILVSQQLLDRIHQVYHSYHQIIEKPSRLKVLAQQLKSKHEPRKADIIDKYEINRNMVRNGVWCPSCKKTIMNRYYGYWYCPTCEHKDRVAHIKALREYVLLFGDTITAKQAAEFLGIDSVHIARRLLLKTGAKILGNKKSATYHLDTI